MWRHASVGVADEPAMGATACWRELRLNTYLTLTPTLRAARLVSAKLFITVEHGGSGFGWCVLPCALVEEFAAEKPLAQLEVLAGRGDC